MITVVIYPNKRKITDFLTRRNGERRNGERELKQSVSRFQSSLNANLLKKKKKESECTSIPHFFRYVVVCETSPAVRYSSKVKLKLLF